MKLGASSATPAPPPDAEANFQKAAGGPASRRRGSEGG